MTEKHCQTAFSGHTTRITFKWIDLLAPLASWIGDIFPIDLGRTTKNLGVNTEHHLHPRGR